jgi:hypothetical protein
VGGSWPQRAPPRSGWLCSGLNPGIGVLRSISHRQFSHTAALRGSPDAIAAALFAAPRARAEDATPVDNCLALRAELEQVEEQLKWIPRHRSRGAVQDDMTVLKAQRNWLTSKACTDLTFEASREFCQRYSTLAAEYASGQEAEKYEAKIAQLGADLATARPGPACLRK